MSTTRSELSALLQELGQSALEIPEVVADLVVLIRDTVGWQELREFVDRLGGSSRRLALVQEQYLLALAETGDELVAIAGLDQLIHDYGDTPERRGLVGGRYKRLWRKARKEREARAESNPSSEESNYLESAIENYTRGMQLDYNQYFCSCNLPQLLRARGEEGDADRAVIIDHFVVAACERALARGEGDEYLRPTLLGAAFRAGDVKRAMELAKSVKREGAIQWKLASLLTDLSESIRHTTDPDKRSQLQQVQEGLARMV